MYLLYGIIYAIALLFLFPFEYLKRRRRLRKRWLKERLGFFEVLRITHHAPRIWIHAVSVGEVIAAVPLIKKINERHPDREIVVSTVTDTGQDVAKERVGNIARIIYIPFDLPFVVKSAIKKVKPSLFIIMETELWPNIIRILSRRDIPVLLMNGRISERSFGRYKKIRFFINDILKYVTLFCMQNELYAERIRQLGAEPDKIKIIGNFKFDTRPSDTVPEWTNIVKRDRNSLSVHMRRNTDIDFTIVAGSTHRTEEDLVLDAYIKLREDFPLLNLIIAPRHPERFREVEELIKKKGLEYIKRSNITNYRSRITGVIILLDVIGELSSVYGVCDIAIIGGSFIQHGGQNPLEPAYWGKVIICGPYMENFPFIDDFYRNGGALKAGSEDLYQTVRELLNSEEKMLSIGKVARELYEKNSGAVGRAIEVIEKYL